MISYEIYKIFHMLGFAFLFLGLGGVVLAYACTANVRPKVRFAGFLCHGLGLLLILVSGFGMAARLGLVQGLPGWIYGKLTIWIVLGISISLAKRKAQWMLGLLLFWAFLAGTAATLAIFKPF
jgi:hypothetical protein